jgi:hypothetical protein
MVAPASRNLFNSESFQNWIESFKLLTLPYIATLTNCKVALRVAAVPSSRCARTVGLRHRLSSKL